MIYRTSKADIDSYFASRALNQSLLKTLTRGLASYNYALYEPEKKLYYEEKGSFTIGSGLDCLVSQGRYELEQQYYIQQEDKCSDTVKSMLKETFDSLDELENTLAPFLPGSIYNNRFLQAFYDSANNHEYYNNRKKDTYVTDTRYETAMKEGIHYWNSLIASKGKIILDAREMAIINNIDNNFRASSAIYKLLYLEQPHIDLYFQVPIYFTIDGIECKVLLDGIEVNHKRKTITPIEIKTMQGDVVNFSHELRKWRYDFQIAFYYNAIISSWRRREFADYAMPNYDFVVGSTTTPTCAYYRCPITFMKDDKDDIFNTGTNGRDALIVNKSIIRDRIKGWKECFEEYKVYKEHGFLKDIRILQNMDEQGRVPLLWNGL